MPWGRSTIDTPGWAAPACALFLVIALLVSMSWEYCVEAETEVKEERETYNTALDTLPAWARKQ